MKQNYKKLVLAAIMLIGGFTAKAQNITLSIENAQQTTDGMNTFYEADIMISSDTDYIQGSGQFFLDYNTAAFGPNVAANTMIDYQRPVGSVLAHQAAGVDSYNQFTVNDNTTSKVSYLWQQFWSSGAIGANNVTSTPTVLVHIRIQYIDDSIDANVCLDATHPFDDQFYTACGPAGFAGADCGGNPGTQIFDYTPDCTNAAPTPLSIGGVDLDNSKFTLYPNPSKGAFMVEGLESEANVSIYSLSGKQLISLEGYNGGEVNISTLSTGMYLVSIESNNAKAVKRLMVK